MKLQLALDPKTVDQLFLNEKLKRKKRKPTITSTNKPGEIEIKEEDSQSPRNFKSYEYRDKTRHKLIKS